MPTLFYIFGFRFYFWSNEHEPIHVHVEKGDAEAKFNISPVELVYNHGFRPNELKLIESLVEENAEVILERFR